MELHCFIAALDIATEIEPSKIFFFHNDSLVVEGSNGISITKDKEDDFLYKATLAIQDINFIDSGTYHCKHQLKKSKEPVHVKVLPIIDCKWSQWGEWPDCSHTCGGGLRSRSRRVLVQAANGGQICEGGEIDLEDCNTQDCPPPSMFRKCSI